MNKQFTPGQELWTFYIDTDRQRSEVYPVVFKGAYRSACMIGEWQEVETPTGTTIDVDAVALFNTRDEAVDALVEQAKCIRARFKLDIDKATKVIDFCKLIEQSAQ